MVVQEFLVYHLPMNRQVIEIIVMVVALIVWFIVNHNAGGTTKYAGAVVIIGVIKLVGNSMKPKQP